MTKLYYRPSEIVALGYPKERVMELARKINRKTDPCAERGFSYLLTLAEVEHHFIDFKRGENK